MTFFESYHGTQQTTFYKSKKTVEQIIDDQQKIEDELSVSTVILTLANEFFLYTRNVTETLGLAIKQKSGKGYN